jgi:NNP family nitrate/nitrite transporter-like MFS transporter
MIAISVFFTSFASSLPGLRGGFFCMGFSAGLYLPSAIAVISGECPRRAWGRAFSVHELAPNMAFVTAPFIVALLLDIYPWQTMFRFQAAILGAVGILFFLFSRGRMEYGTPPDIAGVRRVVHVRGFGVMIVMFSMGIAGTLGVYNLLPLYLVSVHGMSEVAANSVTGFSRIATLAAALTGGWIADRMGAVRTMGAVLAASGMLVAAMGFVTGNLLYACVFLQPVIAVCFFPAAFSALSSLVPADLRNLVISLVVPLAYVTGGGGIPWFIGYLADMNSFSLGVSLAGLSMAAGGGLSVVLLKNARDLRA